MDKYKNMIVENSPAEKYERISSIDRDNAQAGDIYLDREGIAVQLIEGDGCGSCHYNTKGSCDDTNDRDHSLLCNGLDGSKGALILVQEEVAPDVAVKTYPKIAEFDRDQAKVGDVFEDNNGDLITLKKARDDYECDHCIYSEQDTCADADDKHGRALCSKISNGYIEKVLHVEVTTQLPGKIEMVDVTGVMYKPEDVTITITDNKPLTASSEGSNIAIRNDAMTATSTVALNNLTNGENNMTISRQAMVFTLVDNDKGLEAIDAMVIQFTALVENGDTNTVIQESLMDSKIKVSEAIAAHNEKRSTLINLDIQDRTGNSVKLKPIRIKDLTWSIK